MSRLVPSLLLTLTLFARASPAQESNNLASPLPDFKEAGTLSQTLSSFSSKTQFNIVADTTYNDVKLDYDNWPLVKRRGSVLNKESLIFGFFWNQTDANTLLIWPKPDIKPLALSIASDWERQKLNPELSPEVQAYFTSVAQKVNAENEAKKRDSPLAVSPMVRFADLTQSERALLTPLVAQARKSETVNLNQYWLRDEFWNGATIGATNFNNEDIFTLEGTTTGVKKEGNPNVATLGHGVSPSKISFIVVQPAERSLMSASQKALSGSRWEGEVPVALEKPVTIEVQNAPLIDALARLSQKCGVTLQLDDKAAEQLKTKRLTLETTDATARAMLHDIALLFDLKWKSADGKIVASSNEDTNQNQIAKIPCYSCLSTWDLKNNITRPDFTPLLLQETTFAQARKKGIPFTSLSPDLQTSLRSYNEDMAAYEILESWQNTQNPIPKGLYLMWNLWIAELHRNDTPLPAEPLTPEEMRDPKIMAQYNAAFYNLVRPFTVTIGTTSDGSGEDVSARYNFFGPGIIIPQTEDATAQDVKTP